jgi:nucleoside-diphosphate-sugar epimerase
MKRAVVTGGSGFVAANLVRRLLRDGYEAVATVRPQSDTWRIDELRDDIDCIELDITCAERVAEFVGRAKPDTIFHLAARASPNLRHEPWRRDQRPRGRRRSGSRYGRYGGIFV